MKKIFLSIIATATIMSCSLLDVQSVSTITDSGAWQNDGFFQAFMAGLHSRLRAHNYNMFLLGEARSDMFGGPCFGGEASQGMENFPNNSLTKDAVGISNYGGFYENINQLNLMIVKTEETKVLAEATKNYYLGQCYGMRALYYYHLLRSWGDAIITTEPTMSVDPANLAKAQNPATEVMAQIKKDVEASIAAFGGNWTFQQTKSYWSLAATMMLKADVMLWSVRNGGSNADATAALQTLEAIQSGVPSLALQSTFPAVFSYTNKGNSEIIFASRNFLNEFSMWNGNYAGSFLPQNNYLINYYNYDPATKTYAKINAATQNLFGLMRLAPKFDNFNMYDDEDSRKLASLKAVYNTTDGGKKYEIIGIYPWKFQGMQESGATSRSMYDDYPIYRVADLLLMKAEAKFLLGQSPATEINAVRQRAYGANWDDAKYGFGNYKGDDNVAEAILTERFKEFMMEGKRWYDLRRFGNSYVLAHTTADAARLLMPIDVTTLTNNRELKQTPGY